MLHILTWRTTLFTMQSAGSYNMIFTSKITTSALAENVYSLYNRISIVCFHLKDLKIILNYWTKYYGQVHSKWVIVTD